MQLSDQRDEVLHMVEELGLLRAVRRVPRGDDGGTPVLEGEALVEGHEVTLQLVLGESFPLSLPVFSLHPWDALGFIPHVDPKGTVCFLSPEGLVLDRRRPVEIIREGLERSIAVLADGVTGRNQADFVDAFEVYWGRLSGGKSAFSVLDSRSNVCRVTVALDKGQPKWIARDERDISAFFNGAPVDEALVMRKALYLPLERGTFIMPPRHDLPFWTASEARRALLPGLSQTNRSRLKRLTENVTPSTEYVIVQLSRPSGGVTLFGIHFDGIGQTHPLRKGGSAKTLVPLQLERLDRSYLVGRGGGDTDLATKRVLLVGCGAVGGHLAFELMRAGILDLTAVDHDILWFENSFRHVLGRRYWGKNKAESLKAELEADLPYVKVTAIATTIEQALENASISLADYDVIVFALGNPSVELEINRRLYALSNSPPAIFTWLEPFSIGGHALLTGNRQQPGCFEWLYTSPDGVEGTLENRAAFAAPGQSFARALSGCGSLHTPYGSVDGLQTAVLTGRLVVDVLTGKEQGNTLRSWKGDAAAFRAAGFRLSRRYGATEDELLRQRASYSSPCCPICAWLFEMTRNV